MELKHSVALAVLLMVELVPTGTLAQKPATILFETVGTAKLTPEAAVRIEQIRKRWQQLKPKYKGSPYATLPKLSAPHSPGVLKSDFVQDGLNMVNFMRYLAGLPDDIVTDDALMQQAQTGALLLGAVDQLTHTPDRPADMDAALYEAGYRSTTTSNLSVGFTSTYEAVQSYMNDSDIVNIGTLGHRRWLLHPPLQKIGFGYVQGKRGTPYSADQIVDKSRTEPIDFQSISWPTSGAFPVDFWPKESAWSVTLNPEHYLQPEPGHVRVELTRESDSKHWTFATETPNPTPESSFFKVSLDGLGIPNCIIFRPDLDQPYKAGDRYLVDITGIDDSDGKPAKLHYEVTFFDLETDPKNQQSASTK